MNKVNIQAFQLIGMTIRTTNENGQSAKDIPALWEKFMINQAVEKIPHKLSSDIYCMYTNYEGDHTKPYTTFLGCKVDKLEHIPEGMEGISVPASACVNFTANGNLMEGVVWQKWEEIWEADIERSYSADFEIYGENAQNPTDAEVQIFVAVN